jgi:hypothetical protein
VIKLIGKKTKEVEPFREAMYTWKILNWIRVVFLLELCSEGDRSEPIVAEMNNGFGRCLICGW